MKHLSDIMDDYFKSSTREEKSLLTETFSPPVSPQKCGWIVHTSPERFYREFSFQSKQQVIDFLTEVFRYETEVNHSGIQKIDQNTVTIEVYTHDINRITELDQEYIKQIDFIYVDVLNFG